MIYVLLELVEDEPKTPRVFGLLIRAHEELSHKLFNPKGD